MHILPVYDLQNKYQLSTLNFGVNLNSPKLRFKEDDFYVMIKGYGHHSGWAKKIKETADSVVAFIRRDCNFEEALKRVTIGVTAANQLPLDLQKREHSGILRTPKQGWRCISDWTGTMLYTPYTRAKRNKYITYAERLDYIAKHPLKNPYKDIKLSKVIVDNDRGNYIEHANPKCIEAAFRHVSEIYGSLHKRYVQKEAEPADIKNINNSIAEIRWILAHATPWERGSDAISNTFIRALYKAIGIKTTPLKRGISLDLEAYCTNLNEYKEKFANYFLEKPYIVE